MANTPEERVRQALLQKMVAVLGFPKGLIAVEKEIGPRRFDIVCYTPEMRPLLLVECKAYASQVAECQALGYNDAVQAPFICTACGAELKTIWREGDKVVSVPFLPKYEELYAFSRQL